MKKWLTIFIIALVIGCSYLGYQLLLNKKELTQMKAQEKDFSMLLESPKKYIGVKMMGDGLIEKSKYVKGEGVYSIVTLNTEDPSGFVILYEKNNSKPRKSQTYIDFEGEVMDITQTASDYAYKQKTLQLKVNTLKAKNSNLNSDDALVNMSLQKKKEVGNIRVELKKINITPSSTRFFITIENQTKNEVYLNKQSIHLLADGVLIPTKYELLNNKLRLENSVDAGQTISGVVSFKKTSIMTKNLELSFSMNEVGNKEPIKFYFNMEF